MTFWELEKKSQSYHPSVCTPYECYKGKRANFLRFLHPLKKNVFPQKIMTLALPMAYIIPEANSLSLLFNMITLYHVFCVLLVHRSSCMSRVATEVWNFKGIGQKFGLKGVTPSICFSWQKRIVQIFLFFSFSWYFYLVFLFSQDFRTDIPQLNILGECSPPTAMYIKVLWIDHSGIVGL